MNEKSSLHSQLRKAAGIIRKPYVSLPLLAAVSAGLSYALEASGLRAKNLGVPGFSFIAFAGAGILFFVILTSALTGTGGRVFDPSDRYQLLLYCLTALFCVTVCLPAAKNVGESVIYPMTQSDIEGSGPYVQQFDALQKGQVALDVPVSDELAAMENPYDTEQRAADKVQYLWDRAYYNGKYYSYFGLAPILCVFYPFYAIFGSLPSSDAVCLILAVFTVVFLSLALLEFIIYAGAKPRFWLVLPALVSLAFGSGIYAAQSYADVYYIPVLSAMGFNFAALFFVFRAHRSEKTSMSSVLFALASLSFVLAVMSRPTASLMCIAAAPAVIDRIFVKARGAGKKAVLLAPAALIALCGAAVVMTFNYLRFGSPFDFGANYQLTVCDISKNTLTASLIPQAFNHYVIQAPVFLPEFPYVNPSYIKLEYGRYMYLDYNVGLIFFPATLGLAAGPLFARYGKKDWAKFTTFIAGAAAIAFVIFVDFCKAGVNMRYLYDFLPLAVMLGTILFLRATGAARHKWTRGIISLVAAISFFATVIMALGVISANDYDRLFLDLFHGLPS